MNNQNSPNRVNRILENAEPSPEEISQRCDEIRGKRYDNAHDLDPVSRRFRAQLRFIQFLSETTSQ